MNATKQTRQNRQGKPYAPFTLVVEFKPEYYRLNNSTGELITNWCYRSDIENRKLLQRTGTMFTREIDALAYVLQKREHRFKNYALYDNRSNQLKAECVNGKLLLPTEPEKVKLFLDWKKSVLL